MADFQGQTNYIPPLSYSNAYAGADEADDIRYLHASAAIIKIGEVPVVALENLTINQTINRTPIYAVGSIVPLGFDVQGISVNVSGQLVQLAKMSLNQSAFYAKNEADVIANINTVFTIDIEMNDYFSLDNKDADGNIKVNASGFGDPTGAFITVHNCQNTGSSITVNPNTMMKDAFTAVGTFMSRDWDVLVGFNELDEVS